MNRSQRLADVKQLGDLAQACVLVRERIAFNGVGDGQFDLTEAEGLEHVVVRALLHRCAGRLERGETRHDDRDQIRVVLACLANQLDAVHLRHHDVREENDELAGIGPAC